jgi:hypothetical protein
MVMKSHVVGSTRGAASTAREHQGGRQGGGAWQRERAGRKEEGAERRWWSTWWRPGVAARVGEDWGTLSEWGLGGCVGPSFCLLIQLSWWGLLHISGCASGHASGKSATLWSLGPTSARPTRQRPKYRNAWYTNKHYSAW